MRLTFAAIFAFASSFSLPVFALEDEHKPLQVVKLKPALGLAQTDELDSEIRSLLEHIATRSTAEAAAAQDFERIVGFGTDAVPTLQRILSDKTLRYEHHWVTLRALGKIGGPLALKQLRETLKTEKFSMLRLAAVRGLMDMNAPESLPEVRAALTDDAMLVRAGAADALGAMGSIDDIKRLELALSHEDNFYRGNSLWVRRHIVASIGLIGARNRDSKSVRTLAPLLDDRDPTVSLEAVRSLEVVTKLTFRGESEAASRNNIPQWKAWWTRNKARYL